MAVNVLLKNCVRRRLPRALSTMSTRYASDATRNVGILAHIDAGKTTTTERMLYYAGYMGSVGEVHRGDTVMDHLAQERERGITITSAAITFPWRAHQVNLIDTPGHIDFTVEVERSVRVLDGGVVLLDASAGVEAQTLTVWRQADAYRVPRIAFLNKMDKPQASLPMCLDSIREKLLVEPLLVQIPIGEGKDLQGVIDLVDMCALRWDKADVEDNWGRKFSVQPLDEAALKEQALEARTALIDSLCNHDDNLSELLLQKESYDAIQPSELRASLRRATLSQSESGAIVTLCGSAFKNVGVQPLMDAMAHYLPSPAEVDEPSLAFYPSNSLCALAFKTVHHPHKGLLTFLRVYGGSLRDGDDVFNMNKECGEKVGRLMVAFADEFRPVSEVSAGNIAVVSGLKATDTGDTLVTSGAVAKEAINKWQRVKEMGSEESRPSPFLAGVNVPSPVFYCSIEPASTRHQQPLENALRNLAREDPSLSVSTDPDTGQTVLSGMGELHLEIVADRIKREYKVDADLGPLLIAYKERPLEAAEREITFERKMPGQSYSVTMRLSVHPQEGVMTPSLELDRELKDVRWWQAKELRRGIQNAVSCGPLLGYPVIDCRFSLHAFSASRGVPASLLSAAASAAAAEALREAGARLLEPVMRVEVSAAEDAVASAVAQDLVSRRRGEGVESRADARGMRVVTARVPLAELRGYSRHVRTMTSGRAFLGMELDSYEVMDEGAQSRAIEEITGFAR